MTSKETIYRGTNLNPEHYQKWEELAAHASMTRNAFIRFLFVKLTEADVDRLLERL